MDGRGTRKSENLLNGVNGPVRTNLSDADGKQPIEVQVFWLGRFEARQSAKVMVRVVAHTCECHVNQSAVISLEGHAQVEFQGPVGLGRDPVATPGEHFATQALAFERATDDRENGKLALRSRADFLSVRRDET